MTTFEVAQQIPELGFFNRGYLFRDHAHLRQVFDGPLGVEYRRAVSAKMGIEILATAYLGTRQVNLRHKRPVKTPADLAGVKMRMPAGPEWLLLGKALGVSPVPLGMPEVYLGLKTGSIDGQENPLSILSAAKLYEVTEQVVLTSHMVQPVFYAMAKPAFDKLTPEQRSGFEAACRVSAKVNDEERLADEATIIESLKGGTPHRLASGFWSSQRGVEEGAAFQHGTGDVEEAVCDRAERTSMAMTSAAQSGIFGSALAVVLNGRSRPMVHGVGEPVVACLPSNDDTTLARPFGDRRNSCQTAQGGVIPSLQGIEGFCEQRGEDDPSHSRQGCEDFRVTLLLLPRLCILDRKEAPGQCVELTVSLSELPVDQTDAGNERSNMGTGRFCCSSSNMHGRLAQHREHMSRVETTDAIALEDRGNGLFADSHCLGRRRYNLPQIEQPLGPEVVFQFEHGRKVTPELLAHAVRQTIALSAEILGHTRPFAQFDDDRVSFCQKPVTARIGAQGRGHHFGIAAVVFSAGKSEAVAEAIDLLRVDRMHPEASLDQRFHHRPMRDLDSDLNLRRLARATLCHQPGRHRGESFATVLEYPLSDFLAAAVGEEYVVAFRSPVDARIPLFLICHAFSLFSHASHRDLRRSLYWRSEVNRRLRRELPTGHRSRPIRRGTCPTQVVGPQGAIGCSRRIGSVLEGYAISGRRPRVTLRSATLHFA